jgi:hypothetical protein
MINYVGLGHGAYRLNGAYAITVRAWRHLTWESPLRRSQPNVIDCSISVVTFRIR